MNTHHRNIKFTFQEWKDNEISFLEILITRVGTELQTSLFPKKIFSGVYLKFNSDLPNKYTKGLINTLSYRDYIICSNFSSFYQECNYLIFFGKINILLYILLTNVFKSFLISYLLNAITKI